VASRRPDLSGADVLLRDEGERDALSDRHTEWSRITLGGMRRALLVPGGPICSCRLRAAGPRATRHSVGVGRIGKGGLLLVLRRQAVIVLVEHLGLSAGGFPVPGARVVPAGAEGLDVRGWVWLQAFKYMAGEAG
jgi:hypothetical protein